MPDKTMDATEAMAILGLTCAECIDSFAIRRAWKKKLRACHPDKNLNEIVESTKQTQRLNEAKECLLCHLPDYDSVRHMEEHHAELKRRAAELAELKKYHERLDAAHKRFMEEIADRLASAPISVGRVATNLGYEIRWMDSKSIMLDLRKRYVKQHGRPPPKQKQGKGKQVFMTEIYTERDRSLVEEALHAYFRPGEEESDDEADKQ